MADPFTPKFVDLVRNYTTTTGTGSFALGPAVNGYAGFASALQVGDSFYYSAIGVDKPAEREVGRGTLTGNNTITRDPISGSKTNFTGGTKALALIAAAEWFSNVQAGSGGAAAQAASSRSAMAAMTQHQNPALLMESGREGLFGFDASNLTAKVAADPAQAVYVPPSSDVTGASGAWVRKFTGPIDIRWCGGVADCTAVGTGTDNAAALSAALTAAGNGGVVRIPRGKWRFASRPSITKTVSLRGDGWNINPGIVAGTSYSGLGLYDGTVLVFDNGIAGPIFYGAGDNNDASTFNGTTDFKYFGASHSIFEDILLVGGGGTGTAAHGVEARANVSLANLYITGFAGNGLHIDSSAGLANPYGNTNSMVVRKVWAVANKCHGYYVRGDNANVITILDGFSQVNGGCGVLDVSLLGNQYVGHQAATNNQSFGTPAGYSAGQRSFVTSTTGGAQLQSGWAGLSDPYAGSYVTTSAVGAHTFTGCYAETGEGQKHEIIYPSVILGGALASTPTTAAATGAGVPATVLNAGELKYLDTISPRATGGSVNLTGSLKIDPPGGLNATGKLFGSGAYANLQFYPGGSSALGLDILAGLGGGYFSADSFTFRNAAQSTNALTLTTASATFNGAVAASNFSGSHSGTSSGTNTGDQTIALTGNVTGSGTGSFAVTIANSAVTLAKMADVATATVFYRKAAGTGAPEVQTLATLKADLGLTGTNTGDQTIALTGDITGSGTGSIAATIAANAVTYAKFQTVAANALVGNPTGSTATAQAITLAGGLGNSGTTLTINGAVTAATSVAIAGAITSSGGGIGYTTGAGGTVTQATSKSTAVTLNKICGQVTLSAAALAASSAVSFIVTNNQVAATDTIDLVLASGNAGAGTYNYQVDKISAGSFVVWLKNISGGSLSEALTFNFSVKKAVNA